MSFLFYFVGLIHMGLKGQKTLIMHPMKHSFPDT